MGGELNAALTRVSSNVGEMEASTSGKRYSDEQLEMAWRLMCPPGRQYLTSSDVHGIVRSFFPNMSHNEFEQLGCSVKGKMKFESLRELLLSDALPQVRPAEVSPPVTRPEADWHRELRGGCSVQDFDPVVAAFKVFDQDHSGYLSAAEISSFVSQLPGVGKVRTVRLITGYSCWTAHQDPVLRDQCLQVTLVDKGVIMDMVDVDGDGRVSLQDFRKFLEKHILCTPRTVTAAPKKPTAFGLSLP